MPRAKSVKEVEMVVRNCLWCGKSRKVVRVLIAGPMNIHICDECVGICVEILNEDKANNPDRWKEATGGHPGAGGHAVTSSASAAQK